ncbi:MAG: hypothetical protein KF693_09320 [Nitrospira sp.]|nr:hypothetical protein [Nitrospira sp.]
MGSRHLLNLAPVEFEDCEIAVGVFEYQDREQLKKLRESFGATHLLRRDGESKILAVPLHRDAQPIGDQTEKVQLSGHLGLCAALIRHALLNHLHVGNGQIIHRDPIEFVSHYPEDDLLASSMPGGASNSLGVSLKCLYEVVVRVIHLDRQAPIIGLALNLRTRRSIDKSSETLILEGFGLSNRYVGQFISDVGSRVSPRFELLGWVIEIGNGKLILDDTRPGVTEVDTAKAFLEPRREHFDAYLLHSLKERASQVIQLLGGKLAAVRNGPALLQKLQRFLDRLRGARLEILPGLPFKIEPFLCEQSGGRFPQLHETAKPVYIFDPAGRRTDTWHDRGLNQYGPYTAQTFTPTRPRVCVICQASKKGQVEEFFHKLFHGVRVPGDNRKPFEKGFLRKYGLEDVATEFFVAERADASSYQRAVREAIAQQSQRSIKWDLALVQIDERFHALYGEDNPYLLTKAAFLTQQIPVQEFEIETAQLPDRQIGYVLNNIALATYAKLGGVPWLIKANPTISHELVVGLGSAHVGQGRLGDRERVVGITTVFSGDGNYWLANLSQAVPMNDYPEAVLDSLRAVIRRVRRDMNWQPRDHVRLVFHAFKPLKDAEAYAVKTLTNELNDYDMEFAFLHVVRDHPYVLFDQQQRGIWDYQTRSNKGVLAPIRGRFFRLSDHETLMTLTGGREVKRPQDGMPRPVLLRLHRASTFHDTTYLARQVFTFSCHSWRSFFPAPMPVTILYSELIAKLLGHLAPIPRWNPDVMLGRIGTTRWFL